MADLGECVDFSRVERVERVGDEDGRLRLLFIGRLHPLKGVEFLLHAIKEYQASMRSMRSLRLKIIGKDEGEGDKLRQMAKDYGLDVEFCGVVSEDEKEQAWKWCDVLVLPTLSENFGLVVAEALERGKRVITTDGAPAWEGDSRRRESKVGNVLNAKNLPAHCSTSTLNFDSKILSRFDGRLLYLKEYRDGNDADRVRLLKDAIRFYLGQD